MPCGLRRTQANDKKMNLGNLNRAKGVLEMDAFGCNRQ